MSDTCLYCGQPEKSCKPSKSVDFICGRCVQLLITADQADLKLSYEKALTKGHIEKASAIKSFLVEEEHGETEEPERSMGRERAMQAVRPARYEVWA